MLTTLTVQKIVIRRSPSEALSPTSLAAFSTMTLDLIVKTCEFVRFHGKIFVPPYSTIAEQMRIRDHFGIEAIIVVATKDMWRALNDSGETHTIDDF